MRIWDLPAGYLNRQSLLGEHRELHGLYRIHTLGLRGYARHPETVRWRRALSGLVHRHRQLAAEMTLRGYVDRTPLEARWLTLEELLWDTNGRLATAGASTYKLPSWSELPEVFNVTLLTRAAQPGVVMGSKAVGEPPLMLAISVREALRDAIDPRLRQGNGNVLA